MMDASTLATAQKVVASVMMGGQAIMVPLCLLAGKGWAGLYWLAGFTITLAAGHLAGSL